MPLNFTSDGNAKTANLIGTDRESQDTFMVDGEHTVRRPSTVRFTSTNANDPQKTHYRQTIVRSRLMTIDAGLSSEVDLPLTVKLEISTPKGTDEAAVLDAVKDIIGITETGSFYELRTVGVLPSNQ